MKAHGRLMTSAEIAVAAEVTMGSINLRLSSLRQRGLIKRLHGKYGLEKNSTGATDRSEVAPGDQLDSSERAQERQPGAQN